LMWQELTLVTVGVNITFIRLSIGKTCRMISSVNLNCLTMQFRRYSKRIYIIINEFGIRVCG